MDDMDRRMLVHLAAQMGRHSLTLSAIAKGIGANEVAASSLEQAQNNLTFMQSYQRACHLDGLSEDQRQAKQ